MSRVPFASPMRPVAGVPRDGQAVGATAAAAKANAARAGAGSGAVQWGQFQGSTIRFDPSASSQRVPWSGGARSAPRAAAARPAPRPAPAPRARGRGPQASAATDSSDLNSIGDDSSDDDDEVGSVGGSNSMGWVPQAAQEGRDGADSSNDDGRDQAVRNFRRRDGVSQADKRAKSHDNGADPDDAPGALLRAVSGGLGTGFLRQSVLNEFVRRVQAQGASGPGVAGGLGVVRAQLIDAVKRGSFEPQTGPAAADMNCLLPLLMLSLQRTRPPSQQVLAVGRAQRLAALPDPAQPRPRPGAPAP